MERMRTTKNFSRHDARRNSYPILNARGPIRTYPEVAALLGLNPDQVKRAEHSAFRKMRAALAAYGYKDPTT